MSNIDAASNSNEGFVKVCAPDGVVQYCPGWLQCPDADRLFRVLKSDLEWQERRITMFGRTMLQPRLIHFQGDSGIAYCYSGGRYEAQGWHADVLQLRDELLTHIRAGIAALRTDQGLINTIRLNSVLINQYRDGQDSMGWHSDNETELGANPLIASISLGSPRRFILRNKTSRQTFAIEPDHGSLIIMAGDLQHHWQHQVPKTRKPVGARINLTFRTIVET